MSPIYALRYRLMRLLAGRSLVVINAYVTPEGIRPATETRRGMIVCNNVLEGVRVDVTLPRWGGDGDAETITNEGTEETE